MDGLFKKIDKYAGNFLIFWMILFRPIMFLFNFRKNKQKKILIVRLWTLGETLLTFPMIAELRKRYPKANITVLCHSAIKKTFLLNQDVDDILLYHDAWSFLRSIRKYDIAIDTEPWFNSSALDAFWLAKKRIGFSHAFRKHMYTDPVHFNDRQYEAQTFLDLLRPLGITAEFSSFKKVDISDEEKKSLDNLLKENEIIKKDKLIGICPGAEDALYRMWMPASFASTSDYLQKKYKAKIIMIGSKKEYDLCESIRGMAKNGKQMINLAGKTNLVQLFYLVEKLDLLITNDTGPMHVAAVQDVKTVSLFGPNLPLRFAPRTKGSASIYHGDEKNPFINVHKGEIPSTNDRKYYEPIESITVDEVKKACDKVLKSR